MRGKAEHVSIHAPRERANAYLINSTGDKTLGGWFQSTRP